MFINREADLTGNANATPDEYPLQIMLAIHQPFKADAAAGLADAVIVGCRSKTTQKILPADHKDTPRLAYLENDPDNDVLATRLGILMEETPCGVVLGGARTGSNLQRLDTLLSVEEAKRRLPVGRTAILAVIGDNPGGLLNTQSFGGKTQRLKGIGWNPQVLRQNRGTAGTLRIAAELTLLAAANAGVAAFCWLEPELSGEALAEACARARQDGFAALITSEPAQVAAILATRGGRAETPTEAR